MLPCQRKASLKILCCTCHDLTKLTKLDNYYLGPPYVVPVEWNISGQFLCASTHWNAFYIQQYRCGIFHSHLIFCSQYVATFVSALELHFESSETWICCYLVCHQTFHMCHDCEFFFFICSFCFYCVYIAHMYTSVAQLFVVLSSFSVWTWHCFPLHFFFFTECLLLYFVYCNGFFGSTVYMPIQAFGLECS